MKSGTMLKRYAFAAFVVIGALGTLAVVVHQRTKYRVSITVAQIENDIRAQLPVGSSRDEVVSYLDRKGFPHSYIGKLPRAECDNCEIALVRDTAHSWLIRTDIQLYLKFNDGGKLTSFIAREVYTGP